MSVIGFRIDGSIQKYDYNALDNKPDNGLTEATKSALLQLARKVAYIDEHGEDYYQELYDSFYGNFVNVAHLLTNCYSSNTSATAKIGAAYTAIISPDPGCTLTGATVSITMGGTDVTGFYSNGAINIPNVTGDLVITVTAMSAISSISAVYTQSGTVYDTDTLDSLKADLVVTAHYSDSSTQTVPAADYTLSGTLTEGTSTITVSYGGKTTTFNVTVTSGTLSGYTSVGSPTITDGILSVADGKFVKSNVAFSPGNSPWRITCKYRNTSGTYAPYTDILGSVDNSNASYMSLLLEITSNVGANISMYLSSSGASWNIGNGNATETVNIPKGKDVWVWVDFSYTGSAYEFRYSTDGETFTLGKSYSSAAHIVDGYPVAFGLKRNGYLQGEIDLNECKIYIGGQLWWKAIA